MTQAASGAEGINGEVLAAVMAAVQSFLEEEGLSSAVPDNRISRWKLAVRADNRRLTFELAGAWRGAA